MKTKKKKALAPQPKLFLYLKNAIGWRTNRKIIVFTTDDYGTIRMASKEAREKMRKAGMNVMHTRFDYYDALEDKEDLLQLYETLSSVKDENGNHPVFTAMASPANPDYEKIKEENFEHYHYELLPDTYNKLEGYQGTYDLWKEGIERKLIFPQFHGREHLNLKFFMESLRRGNFQANTAFNNRSFAAITDKLYPGIGYTAAFAFTDFNENEYFKEIIRDGLNAFEKVFGFRAEHFAAPGARENRVLEKAMFENGIKFIDKDFITAEPLGNNKFKRVMHYTGQRNKLHQIYMVRNCLFEPVQLPSVPKINWVNYCLDQVDIAFRLRRPANISGHRVNYSGHIEPSIRGYGLSQLRILLNEIVIKWPDVEFMTALELGKLIEHSQNDSFRIN